MKQATARAFWMFSSALKLIFGISREKMMPIQKRKLRTAQKKDKKSAMEKK